MPAGEPRIQQNYSIPVTGGSTIALNNLTTASATVLDAAPQRKKITFHNPNYDPDGTSIDIMVSQAKDINDASISPTFASPGGGIVVLAGESLIIQGDAAQGAWKACARSGTTGGLTILASNTID